MGTTHSIGIGYGISFDMTDKLEEASDKAIDTEFLVEDHYPLLAYDTYGHYDGDIGYLILVKETHEVDYDFMITKKKFPKVINEKALQQMQDFCKEYDLKYKPEWKIFSSAG